MLRAHPRAVPVAIAVTVAAAGVLAIRLRAGGGGDAPLPATAGRGGAVVLVRRASEAARTVFLQEGTYDTLTAASLRELAPRLRVVDGRTPAAEGEVSVEPAGDVLLLATPAGADACVFGRDEPTRAQLLVTTRTGRPCRASAAPDTGWELP
jgi:hypothetical protein